MMATSGPNVQSRPTAQGLEPQANDAAAGPLRDEAGFDARRPVYGVATLPPSM